MEEASRAIRHGKKSLQLRHVEPPDSAMQHKRLVCPYPFLMDTVQALANGTDPVCFAEDCAGGTPAAYIRWITTFSVNCREMHLHEYQSRLSKFLRTHLQGVLK